MNIEKEENQIMILTVILMLLIVLVPLLTELVDILIIFTPIVGVIYALYLLKEYDKKTGNLTDWIERKLKWGRSKYKNIDNKAGITKKKKSKKQNGEVKELLETTVNEKTEGLEQQVHEIKTNLKAMKEEQKGLELKQLSAITDTVKQYAGQIEQNTNKRTLDSIFGKQPKNYEASIGFEREEQQKLINKKKEELENKSRDLEHDRKFLEQDKRINEYYFEAKEDRYKIRMELQVGLTNLEKGLITIQSYFMEKILHLESSFNQSLVQVKESLMNLQTQFGKELVRLDKQQIQIIGKLQEYNNKVKAYSNELLKYKNYSERLFNRAENLYQKSNNAIEKKQIEIESMSKGIELQFQKIALKDEAFANKVGQAKLLIDTKAQDINIALKDMAYERIGINMLRQEHEQRAEVEQQKMHNLISKQKHLEDKLLKDESKGREVAGLRHQLYMVNENLQHTRNRANLMFKEASIVKKLSK